VTGSSTLEDYGQGVRIPHFSALPEPIQYEFVYESAKGTAFRDSLSGAYDGFLYGGDGQRVDGNYKFPAESVIEDRMLLESSRVLAQGKRDLLKGLVERLRLRKNELDTEAKYKSVEDQISSIEESLLQNARLLDGHERDADGVDWSGRKLGDSSWGIRLVRLYSPFITLLFVAFVDMAVLMMSLAVFIGNDIEGIIFAIPALGIQIAFPHMVGERLALVIRGKSKKVFDLVTVFVLLTSWATFAALIAVVRNQHLTSIANEEIRTMTGVSAQIASDELSIRAPITFAITLFIVLGLGVWLIFSAYKDNPYERQYLRLAARKSQLQRKQFVIRSMVEKARETVALQDEAVILLKATTEEHASAVGELFPVAAKNIYKRALINAFASPDFTTAATRTEGKSDES
jgi:uncharacterized protein (DUF1778 family)